MAPVQIELRRGDILSTKADVCVSSIHRSKDMTRGPLAKHVLKTCGSCVQKELLENCEDKDLENGQVEVTSSGNLKHLKSLMFVCLYQWRPGNNQILLNSVLECLELAVVYGFHSIAFPALGMGGLKYPAHLVAAALIEAVALHNLQYSEEIGKKESGSHSLKTVYIVLLDEQTEAIKTFLRMCVVGKTEIGESSQDGDELGDSKVHTLHHHGSADWSTRGQVYGAAMPTGAQGGARVKSGGAQSSHPASTTVSKGVINLLGAVSQYAFQRRVGFFVFSVRPTVTNKQISLGLNASVDISFFTDFIPQKLTSFFKSLTS